MVYKDRKVLKATRAKKVRKVSLVLKATRANKEHKVYLVMPWPTASVTETSP